MSARLVIKPNCVVRVREEDEIMMMFFFKTSARREFGIQCLGGGGVDPSRSRAMPEISQVGGLGGVFTCKTMSDSVGFRREEKWKGQTALKAHVRHILAFCSASPRAAFLCVCVCVCLRYVKRASATSENKQKLLRCHLIPPPLPHL